MVVEIRSEKEYVALFDMFQKFHAHWCRGSKHHVINSIKSLGKSIVEISFKDNKLDKPYIMPIDATCGFSFLHGIQIQDLKRKILNTLAATP